LRIQSIFDIDWQRCSLVAECPLAKAWLTSQANLGLAPNTVEAYGRALADYLLFCSHQEADPVSAGREIVFAYVRDLTARRSPYGGNVRRLDSGVGLANATLQQRLTAVRLFYDYLREEGLRADNPVGRGRYTPGKNFGGASDRGLIPRFRKLPWVPSDEQWQDVLQTARRDPVRNRLMLALSYDAGLRREELCSLRVTDFDPARCLLQVRAETTKNRRARVVPYSEPTAELYAAYLRERRSLSQERGPLFRSESRRNHGQPVSIWTWSKAVAVLAGRSHVEQFTTHTPRHLCLTDLARAGWDIHEIATFAGHRSTQTTLLYIHLSGRDLSAKLQRSMESVHAWRTRMIAEILG
jgi:site-specific recombinase XerD